MDCKFCNKRFSSIYTLKYHQENTRYCLIKQGKKKYICNYCNTELKNNTSGPIRPKNLNDE